GVVNQVDHAGRGSHSKVAGGFIAITVEMLVPRIQGRRKHRALLPPEGVLWFTFIPHRRGASTANDINQLFEHMFLRLQCLAGRDFTNVRIIGLTGALQADTRRQSPRALPRFQWHLVDIFNKEALDDGNPLAGNPSFIGTALFSNRRRGNLWFFHLIFPLARRLRKPRKDSRENSPSVINSHQIMRGSSSNLRFFARNSFSRFWIRQSLEKSLSFQLIQHRLIDKLPE